MAQVVLDNGAYTAKIGLSSTQNARSLNSVGFLDCLKTSVVQAGNLNFSRSEGNMRPRWVSSHFTNRRSRVIPNCIIKAKNVRNRIFIGEQIDECKDLSGLYYLLPFQKGYLVNWEIEKQVWDHLFGKDGFKVHFNEASIIVTEPYFNFSSIQETMNEILFEEYDFHSVYRCNAGFLAQYKNGKQMKNSKMCCLVVDAGYSFTHIIPYYDGKKLKDGLKRMNVGGKILTNHLKEIISYRQLMVMDETYVMNQMKEDVCFVSTQFQKDMEIARKRGPDNTVVREYVLPDYTHIKRGHVRSPGESSGKSKGSEQVIQMNNERFAVPEILFHPSDIGIQEMGIPEAITHAVNCLPEEMHPHLYDNIVLTGGCCMLPGFKERVYSDLRALVPDEYDINVYQSDSPITYAWEGGSQLCKDVKFKKMTVTKQEFEEHGSAICEDRFDV